MVWPGSPPPQSLSLCNSLTEIISTHPSPLTSAFVSSYPKLAANCSPLRISRTSIGFSDWRFLLKIRTWPVPLALGAPAAYAVSLPKNRPAVTDIPLNKDKRTETSNWPCRMFWDEVVQVLIIILFLH